MTALVVSIVSRTTPSEIRQDGGSNSCSGWVSASALTETGRGAAAANTLLSTSVGRCNQRPLLGGSYYPCGGEQHQPKWLVMVVAHTPMFAVKIKL